MRWLTWWPNPTWNRSSKTKTIRKGWQQPSSCVFANRKQQIAMHLSLYISKSCDLPNSKLNQPATKCQTHAMLLAKVQIIGIIIIILRFSASAKPGWANVRFSSPNPGKPEKVFFSWAPFFRSVEKERVHNPRGPNFPPIVMKNGHLGYSTYFPVAYFSMSRIVTRHGRCKNIDLALKCLIRLDKRI